MQPLIDITSDGHVHTRLCNHASGEMEEYVLKAIQNGLKTITFLEHLETDIRYQPRSWLEKKDFDYYFLEGARLQRHYHDVITIRLGVEAGFNPLAKEGSITERLQQYPWDRIGLSCHFFRHGMEDLNLLSRNQESLARLALLGIEDVLTAYFDALIKATQVIDCDVLCHLDAALRHYPGIRFHHHRAQIETLLDCMKDRGIALEINTSGIVYRGTPFPAPWIIAKALERGISLSAGSDAHHPEQVGRHFEQLPAYLSQIKTAKPLTASSSL